MDYADSLRGVDYVNYLCVDVLFELDVLFGENCEVKSSVSSRYDDTKDGNHDIILIARRGDEID